MAIIDTVDLPFLLVLAGFVLMVMEALAPGAHFIVLGVALLFAGLIGMAFGPLGGPLVLAALVLVIGAAALFAYREFDLYGGSGSARTSDSDSLKGKTGRVTERVTATEGQVKLDDGGFNPYFQARSLEGEIPEGTEVMVVDPGGGNVLTVDSMEKLDRDEIDRELERSRGAVDGGDAETETASDGDVETEQA